MHGLPESELITNPDGSIYHLNLRPEQLAPTVITVGDPERVEKITRHFDRLEVVVRKREFHTQTGYYKGKRISVISTGIGTDNIDIVMNELDALVNIDFASRSIKKELTRLDIIRIGTSGSLHSDIPVDSLLASEMAIGLDALLHFYHNENVQDPGLNQALLELYNGNLNSRPYSVAANAELLAQFDAPQVFRGITVTNIGFYGPQGRVLRLPLASPGLNNKLASFMYQGKKITNMEMETSGIYALSKLLGHRAVSLNAIVANRATGTFSSNPDRLVDELIVFALERLVRAPRQTER